MHTADAMSSSLHVQPYSAVCRLRFGAFLFWFLFWLITKALLMQCWDARQPWRSLGHSWTLWKEGSVGRIKWGMLQVASYATCLSCHLRCILPIGTMIHLRSWDLFSYSSLLVLPLDATYLRTITTVVLRMFTSNGLLFCLDSSLLETKLPMHSLRD